MNAVIPVLYSGGQIGFVDVDAHVPITVADCCHRYKRIRINPEPICTVENPCRVCKTHQELAR